GGHPFAFPATICMARQGEGDPTRPPGARGDDTPPPPSLPIRRHCPALPVPVCGNERCVARCPDDQVIGRRPDLGCVSEKTTLPRKEVIQPQLPLRLPCYDFVPITRPTLD